MMNKNKRGFTLIELIVVMAIIGILVMLAMPKFMGYTEKAKLTNIQNDIKVAENKVEELLVKEDKEFYEWDDADKSKLEEAKDERKLYGRGGLVTVDNPREKDIEAGEYRIIDTKFVKVEVRSKLKGTFYANSDGRVYYEDVKAGKYVPTPEDPDNPGGGSGGIGDDKDDKDKEKVDKSELIAKIEEAESLNPDDYESGWDELEAALDNGKIVRDDEDASQEEVNDAKRRIENAIDGLRKVPEGIARLSSLPIGSIIVDADSMWEHKTGSNYSGSGEKKPIEWLVVAQNHYRNGETTVLTNEVIGKYAFDDSTDRGSNYGSNHWGNSGTTNATHGIRPWLNNTFYNSFSSTFKQAVIETTLENKDYNGNSYTTKDKVWLPSQTEMGLGETYTYKIGIDFGYFKDGSSRIAKIDYWTRSPSSSHSSPVHRVLSNGSLSNNNADNSNLGVRPALHLKSDILVEHIGENRYKIID